MRHSSMEFMNGKRNYSSLRFISTNISSSLVLRYLVISVCSCEAENSLITLFIKIFANVFDGLNGVAVIYIYVSLVRFGKKWIVWNNPFVIHFENFVYLEF
ncbi:hypothetical protein ACOME3_003678 [Neoechinorhynchus agilis]